MADPRVITQTLVVGFGQGSDTSGDVLIAEIDGRDTGLNKGKTTFSPGEDVYILAYISGNVSISSVIASHGTVFRDNSIPTQVVDQSEFLVFSNVYEATVQKPLNYAGGLFDFTWLGNNLGNVIRLNDSKLRVSSGPTLVAPYVGVGLLEYNSSAIAYKLTNTLLVGQEEYQIAVQFTGLAT